MDDVQRKLKLIDDQLAGGRNFHKKIITTAPLLCAAAGLIAGIMIQNTIPLPIRFWLVLLILCAIATVSYCVLRIVYRVKQTGLPYTIAYITLICSACLGAIRLTDYYQPEYNDIRNLVADKRKLATIRGVIVSEPHINKNRGWEFAKFQYTDPGSSFYLKINEVETTSGWAEVSGTVRVYVDEPVLDLKAGDYIQAYCWLDKFRGPTNPGQFDTAKYLSRRNIFIAVSVKSRDGIELLEGMPPTTFAKVKRAIRQTATQALLGDLSPTETSRGLLQALLLGYRGDIDSATYEAFRKTGLLHFISLSGMHLGILMGIIWWLCRTAGLMKPARAIICIIAIGVFLLVVPPRAPTLRAAIICCVFCASFLFRRRPNSLNTLALAAIILLLIRPTELFEAGWQLSFASVLGIIFFTDRIGFFIYERITNRSWYEKTIKTKVLLHIIARSGSFLLNLFAIGLAAWLGGAGILLYHFYTITPLTSIWTVIAFPFVAAILIIGFLKIILSLLLPSLAAMLGVIVSGLSNLLIWIVAHIASWNISEILIGNVSWLVIVYYYSIILFAGFVYFRRPLLKKAACMAMVLVMIVFLGALKWQRANRDNLAITALDVSHGQAILVRLPGKINVLFDAGSLYKNDIGRRIVTAFLNYSGINKIDAIIISHNDIDHINGIPEIVEHCKVNGIYANSAFFNKADKWGTAKFLKKWLNEKGFEIKNPKDLNLNSVANIKTLWPTEQICQNEELGDNDKSIVSLIEFADRKILLCSDIERFAQRELVRLFPNLKADAVVVPHHGPAKTLSADFLKKLNPGILIISCSQGQYKRQQEIKRKDKAKLFCTAKDGAITVYIDKDGSIRTTAFTK